MKIKIFIGTNEGLPRVEESFDCIDAKIVAAGLEGSSINVVTASADRFEYPALQMCWEHSQDEDFYGLYLHCKGASKSDELEFNNCIAWLEYMLFGLLENYKLCLDHMDKGADLVGSLWYRHFKGNCFWFKSSYVRSLKQPFDLDMKNRYAAEYWCSQAYWFNPQAKLPRVKNLFYMPLEKDSDFLGLKHAGYVPDINYTNECNDLSSVIAKSDYSVFDKIVLSKEEHDHFGGDLFKYMNYDSKIIVKNEN